MLSATSHVCPARQYVTAETLTRQEPMSGREYLPFVRAKARFAGQKAQEHILSVEMLLHRTYLPCIVGGIFWRKVPRVPCPSRRPSVRPARSHSLPEERLLPDPLRHPSLPCMSRFRRIGSHLRRVIQAPDRHCGRGHPGTNSLLRCFCVEQEAARSRCAAHQKISGLPRR